MKSLGNAIEKYRHLKGWSLRETAERSNVSHTCIALVEDGEASLALTLRVALTVGLPPGTVKRLAQRDVGQMVSAAA